MLDRIPKEIRPDIEEVIVSDDHSDDSTYLVGLGYQQISDLPITLIRQPANLGYGGNQKAGYDLAIEHGLDIVVMLHGDGQYAPESLPDIVAPLIRGEADAVFGYPDHDQGSGPQGGHAPLQVRGQPHPVRFENAALGTELSEFHSATGAYAVSALKQIPFERNSDGFNFDTQIIIQLHDAGMRIAEVPIPTYYGDEICYVDGVGYAADVTRDVVAYRLQKAGFGDGSRIALSEEYQLKPSEDSSHGRISTLLKSKPPSKILDLGCSSGLLAERLVEMGHHVTGVDVMEITGVGRAHQRLREGRPQRRHPRRGGHRLRHRAGRRRARAPGQPRPPDEPGQRRPRHPTGRPCSACPTSPTGIPAALHLGHVRLRPAGHPRLHPPPVLHPPSIRKLVERQGFTVRRIESVGLPLDALGMEGTKAHALRLVDRLLLDLWPTMFGYQFHRRGHAQPALTAHGPPVADGLPPIARPDLGTQAAVDDRVRRMARGWLVRAVLGMSVMLAPWWPRSPPRPPSRRAREPPVPLQHRPWRSRRPRRTGCRTATWA